MQKMTPFGIGTAGFIQLVHCMTACDRCKTQLKKNHHVLHQQLQQSEADEQYHRYQDNISKFMIQYAGGVA